MSTGEYESNAYESTATSEPTSGVPGAKELAGPGIRFGVGIIDYITSLVVGAFIGKYIGAFILGIMLSVSNAGSETTGDDTTAIFALGSIVGFLLSEALGQFFMQVAIILLEAFFGVSPAGKILGIKVAREDGTPGDIGVYFIRAVVKFLPFWLFFVGVFMEISELSTVAMFLFIIWILGLFMALGESKRTLYDKLTGTAVIRTK